jgi:hypothetical protein
LLVCIIHLFILPIILSQLRSHLSTFFFFYLFFYLIS